MCLPHFRNREPLDKYRTKKYYCITVKCLELSDTHGHYYLKIKKEAASEGDLEINRAEVAKDGSQTDESEFVTVRAMAM